MARTAPIIVIETIELGTPSALDAVASSAWVSASDLLMQILQRPEEATKEQKILRAEAVK